MKLSGPSGRFYTRTVGGESIADAIKKPDKKTALHMQAEVDELQEKMNRFYIDHVFTKRAFVKPEQESKADAFYQQQVDTWKKNNAEVSNGHSHQDETDTH